MEWDDKGSGGQTHGLQPGGKYPARVAAADEGTSENGNPKITLELHIDDGRGFSLKRWKAITPAFMPTLEAFCVAAGLEKEYRSRSLDALACVGRRVQVVMEAKRSRSGKVWVDTFEPLQDQPDPPQGVTMSNAQRRKAADAMPDDEVPF